MVQARLGCYSEIDIVSLCCRGYISSYGPGLSSSKTQMRCPLTGCIGSQV